MPQPLTDAEAGLEAMAARILSSAGSGSVGAYIAPATPRPPRGGGRRARGRGRVASGSTGKAVGRGSRGGSRQGPKCVSRGSVDRATFAGGSAPSGPAGQAISSIAKRRPTVADESCRPRWGAAGRSSAGAAGRVCRSSSSVPGLRDEMTISRARCSVHADGVAPIPPAPDQGGRPASRRPEASSCRRNTDAGGSSATSLRHPRQAHVAHARLSVDLPIRPLARQLLETEPIADLAGTACRKW